jgi:Ca2+-binding EF-hand superfamily protein
MTAPDAAPCAAPKLDAEHRAMARALFERFDTDHDGRVSQSELRDGLRSMGMDLDDGTFDSLWRKMTPEG